MDAKERLRRYLEQRRESGESELVLDGMSVDDVLTVLGARTAAPRQGTGSRAVAASSPPPEIAAPDVRFADTQNTDWRSALRGETRTAPPAQPMPTDPVGAAAPEWLRALGLPAGIVIAPTPTIVSHGAAHALPLATLADVAEAARVCTSCVLHKTATHVVPGEGNPNAELVCVGEAPGANEDAQGRPFVGDAGSLLSKILLAIQLERDDVFICNVLKHRPPMNRDPLPDEVLACQPYLLRQLELVRPRVILALGRFAAQTLLRTTRSIGELRGQLHSFHGTPLLVTYHPAALLRNEAWKRPAWDDVRLARRVLDAARVAAADSDARA